MPAYKITVIRNGSIGTSEVKKGMNVEVFCDDPRNTRTGELLSEAFENKYGFSISGMSGSSISSKCRVDGFFELEEL